jgi:hypothetical protein
VPHKIMTVHHVTLRGDLVDDFELIKSFYHCTDNADVVREAMKVAARHVRTVQEKKGKQDATPT